MESADNCAPLCNDGGGGVVEGGYLSRKGLIALVKKEELDCGDPDSPINHGIALSPCFGYGLETA